MNRRPLLAGLAALVPLAARAQSLLGPSAAPAATPSGPAPNPQAPYAGDTVGRNLTRAVISRWGDPLLPGAPPFDPAALTPEQAATQFPWDAILAGVIAPPPAQDGIPSLVAVFANPYPIAAMVYPLGQDNPDVSGKLQGATVMNLQYQGGKWLFAAGGYQCRRITDGTLCQLSGPAAGALGATAQGLLGPRAACTTPWNTALLAEGDPGPLLTALAGTEYGFSDPANGAKFGWVAELDPLDPAAFPIKRTALGRFPRAGIAAVAPPDGRPIIFMAQNDPAGFLFRFIAATNATDGTALDSGQLAVAQIQDDQIVWLDLPPGNATLVGTVGAAKSAGASPFDSPSGLAIAPDGTLYLACRGNPARDPLDTNFLNPRAGDDNGHVLAFTPDSGSLAAKTFTGAVAIAAGNPATAQFTQYTAGSKTWFRKPATLNLDAQGQLWIGTDQNGALNATADGLFIMQTAGPSRFLVDTAYLAPIGAAIGGAAFVSAGKFTFSTVRHPGAAQGASFAHPATRWPSLQPNLPPQTTVIGLAGQ